MNYVISIVNPKEMKKLVEISRKLEITMGVVFLGHGTAVQSMLDLLGIESNEKRVAVMIVSPEKTRELIREEKKQMFIGVPGHGIVVSVPIKSIGGGKTVAYLNQDQQSAKYVPELNYSYELILAIANEGRTDMVMNAARSAGATGGTVLHGKGTGSEEEAKFYKVSIAQEKEVIMIVARAEQKAAIMQAILRKAGPDSEAGTIVFSLPVSEVAGFGMFDEE